MRSIRMPISQLTPSEISSSDGCSESRSARAETRSKATRPLRVLKFGGTSVAGPSCIERVVRLIKAALTDSNVVVVVSAMSGVTNELIEAATASELGKAEVAETILGNLRERHMGLISSLIRSTRERERIQSHVRELLQTGDRLIKGVMLLHELTPRTRDCILSLGERLCAPVVAAALLEIGVPSEAISATELIITDSYHGTAEPQVDLTRESCRMRLQPLLQRGIVPVVTGFIGASVDGALTTLGRGGSDYSATIIAAALDAHEVIVWKDVDGLHTADPRLVPGACTIPEISYLEAAELAYFGAKVLHPKTLNAIMKCGIPLSIRNTFAPERPGTKITSSGPQFVAEVTAVTAISDVALITLGGAINAGASGFLGRTFATTAGLRTEILLLSQSSSQNETCLVVPANVGTRTVEALRREFAADVGQHSLALDQTVSIVSVIGAKVRSTSSVLGRIFSALSREEINIRAIAQGSSACSLSFIVSRDDVKNALAAIHEEFHLAGRNLGPLPDRSDETPLSAA